MKRYFVIIHMLLIIAGAYFGVNVFYGIVSLRLETKAAPAFRAEAPPTVEVQSPPPLTDYRIVNDRNLFNISGESETESARTQPAVDIESLEKTELELKLWGTVTGDRKKSYAVIEELKSREQNLYRIGDTIQNTSAILKMILRRKVILSADGKDQILEMEETATERSKKGTAASAVAKRSTSQDIVLKRAAIMNAVGNLNQLMQQARLRPYFSRGKPAGMVLSSIKANSIFSQMGLKNGDIITGVDGRDIKSVDDALGMYDNLKSASTVALQIKRRGRIRTHNYRIE